MYVTVSASVCTYNVKTIKTQHPFIKDQTTFCVVVGSVCKPVTVLQSVFECCVPIYVPCRGHDHVKRLIGTFVR